MIYGFMGRKVFYRFITAAFIFAISALVIYIAFPSEVKSDFLTGHVDRDSKNIFDQVLVMLVDGQKNKMSNASPSEHWGNSLLIALAFRSALFDKKATKTKRIVAWALYLNSILICLSTLFIKEHYIFDGVLAVLICEVAWIISCHSNTLNNKIEKFFYRWNCRLKITKDKSIAPFRKKNVFVLNWALWIFLVALLFVGVYFTTYTFSLLATTLSYLLAWMLGVLIYYLLPFKNSKNYIDANTGNLKFK